MVVEDTLVTRPRVGAREGQQGQSLTELIFLIPVLMVILVGVINFGPMFFAKESIESAAHVGALYGSSSEGASTNTVGIQNAALAGASSLMGHQAGVNPTVTSAVTTEGSYKMVTVTVTYTYTPLFPVPGLPSSFTFVNNAKMRVYPA